MFKLARNHEYWEILQFQLGTHVQNKGIGRHLLEKTLMEAQQHGLSLKLSVLKTNPAQRLYAALGFRTVGEDQLEYQMAWDCV